MTDPALEYENLLEGYTTRALKRNLGPLMFILALLHALVGVTHYLTLDDASRGLMVWIYEGSALVFLVAGLYLQRRQLSAQGYRAMETAMFSLSAALICLHVVSDGRPEMLINVAIAAIGFGIFSYSRTFVISVNVVFLGVAIGMRMSSLLPGAWDHMIMHLLQASLLSGAAFMIRERIIQGNIRNRMKVARSEAQLRDTNAKLSRSMNDSLMALRRAEKAMKAKSDFLAAISHEIRTPMNGIRVAANLLAGDESLPGDKRRLAEIVQSSTDVLTSILNDVLDMSKIESGKLDLNPQIFDFSALLRSVEEMWHLPMEDKGLDFSVTSSVGSPLWLEGDEVRIRQIIFNLLSNALKFTEKGRVEIDVAVYPASPVTQHIDLVVRDTGMGISKKYLKDLFKPFSQEDASVSTRFGGTGLGLSICHELAQLMDGQLTVDSERGKGTAFTLSLTLPERAAPQKRDKEAASQSSSRVEENVPLNILVAEDNGLNQELIKLLFAKMDRKIDVVDNGDQALKACLTGHYDVAFLDIKMPIMDGLSCARAIRAQMSPADQPVLVALSANSLEGDVAASLEAGMDRHLAKPIDFDGLKRCLEEIEAELSGTSKLSTQRRA